VSAHEWDPKRDASRLGSQSQGHLGLALSPDSPGTARDREIGFVFSHAS